MSPLSPWSPLGGLPARGGHLDRLHGNLLDLEERLREAVAQAIGQAAASVVGRGPLPVRGRAGAARSPAPPAPRPAGPSRPLWQTLDDPEERDRPPWLDEPAEDDFLHDRDTDHERDRPVDGP